jgi:DNA-binding transcriptional LysR family regulator
MDVVDLRVFESVARQGSMNKAAAELDTVQSNVTARIRALENELGVALFERHRRGVKLTPAGTRLLPFSARVAKVLADAKRAARDDGVPSGSLEIGTLETTAALRLPALLATFTKAYPDVRPIVRTGTSYSLVEDVVEGRLEGAFVAGPVNHPDLEQDGAFREKLVLVTPTSIQSLDDLASVTDLKLIVFRVGCSYRGRLEALLANLGIVAAQPLEFGSVEAIIGCVAAGIGVTLLPKASVAAACREERVRVHELAPEFSEVETVFVRRSDTYVSSALAAFLDLIRPDNVVSIAAAE